jgi:nicotinate-nucleotide adenylyltransferase
MMELYVHYKHPIGLLGGTFDPIHQGHINIAKHLLQELGLSSIHFIPNKLPPHRPPPHASAEHRLAMVQIATARYRDFVVNDMEIARPAPSYMIDTLRTLRSLIPNQPLCLILGIDQFIHFNQWYLWEKITELAHLVVVNRPDYALPEETWIKELLAHRQIHDTKLLGAEPSGKIFFVCMKPTAVSATEIRKKIKKQESIAQEVPAEILRYIQEHGLYK